MGLSRSGILLVDKPEGPSSAQVVAVVKGITEARKVGHLGTLDPFASGLLPLALNEGTKIAQYFLDADKGYTGSIVLGVETETQDRTGEVLSRREVPVLGSGELDAVCREFSGYLHQVPPMYSALKREGVRLYELARKGLEVGRETRVIRVTLVRLEQVKCAELEFELTCSKGTYVRTLAADIGTFLGCGAHLSRLRRVASGPFGIADAVTLEELGSARDIDSMPLLSLNRALGHLACTVLDSEAVGQIRRGIQGSLAGLREPAAGETTRRVVDREGDLVALIVWESHLRVWQILRVFNLPGYV